MSRKDGNISEFRQPLRRSGLSLTPSETVLLEHETQDTGFHPFALVQSFNGVTQNSKYFKKIKNQIKFKLSDVPEAFSLLLVINLFLLI